MTPDQRKAYKRQLRQQWASLSPIQKAQEIQQYDAEWNALPQTKKQKIESHIQQHAAKQAAPAADDSDQ